MNGPAMRTMTGLALTLALLASSPAQGAEASCEEFDWSVEWEQTALARASLPEASSGSAIDAKAAEAFVLKLEAESSAKLAVEPTGKSKAPGAKLYAGIVTIEDGAGPGTIFVTLASDGWIDVVQDGKALASIAHTGSKNCPGVRKSVQFDVLNKEFIIQIAGAPADTMKVSVRRAD